MLHSFKGLVAVEAACVEHIVGFEDGFALFWVEAVAAHAHAVEAADGVGIHGHEVGWYIHADACLATYHDEFSNAGELVDDYGAAEECEVLNGDVPSQKNVVDEGDAVADLAVVCDVGTCHEEATIADFRAAAFFGAAVDGGVFADDAIGTDLHVAYGTWLECGVLWFRTDDGAVADFAMRPDDGVAGEDGVSLYGAACAELHVLFDDGAGADGYVFCDVSLGVYDGGWVDHKVPRCSLLL